MKSLLWIFWRHKIYCAAIGYRYVSYDLRDLKHWYWTGHSLRRSTFMSQKIQFLNELPDGQLNKALLCSPRREHKLHWGILHNKRDLAIVAIQRGCNVLLGVSWDYSDHIFSKIYNLSTTLYKCFVTVCKWIHNIIWKEMAGGNLRAALPIVSKLKLNRSLICFRALLTLSLFSRLIVVPWIRVVQIKMTASHRSLIAILCRG